MDIQKFINYINEYNVFGFTNGIVLKKCEPGYAEAELVPAPTSNSNIGFPHIHGGILFTMADSVAGTAAMAHGNVCVTLNSSISYVKSATRGLPLKAVARKIHQGKRTGVYDVEITEEGVSIARGTFTMYMLDGRIEDILKEIEK